MPPIIVYMLGAALVLAFAACTSSDEPDPTPTAPPSTPGPTSEPTPEPASLAVRVDGNQLVNERGEPIRLAGVHRAGTEVACARGEGIFDPSGDTDTASGIASWGANAVRIPLNEHCWLDRNGVADGLGGEPYRAAIRNWVDAVNAEGLVAVLALAWSASGDELALGNDSMANAEHSQDFWTSVAGEFRDLPGVVFDAYSSPNGIDWDCWLNGCEQSGRMLVGMSHVVAAIRSRGAQQPIILTGINFGADLSEWTAHVPDDPAGQLVIGFQNYNFGGCADLDCWRRSLDPLLDRYPVVVTELAEFGCDGNHLSSFIDFADARGISYFAWAFNPWGDCNTGALVLDDAATPSVLGAIVKGRLGTSASDPLVKPVPIQPTTSVPVVSVEGNRLVDAEGTALLLRGVNRAGTEYACAQGWGFFDVNGDELVAQAIASWEANVVRVSLNEHCWLDRNGVPEGRGGEPYREAIEEWVGHLHDAGLITIITLHWAAFADELALDQERMANVQHSIDFWRSVAERFKDEPGVLYQLYAEPHEIDWDCWENGCLVDGHQTASMQQLVDAVRSTGSTQPVIVSGIDFAANLSEWLQRRPDDPAGQLVAGFHTYNFSRCNDQECWDETIAPVAEVVPVVTVELGESTCDGSYVEPYIDWAEERSISWVAWTFNQWPTCEGDIALVVDEQGTPTPLGSIIRDRLSTPARQPDEVSGE